MPRVAKARNLPRERVRALVTGAIRDRFLGIFGEKRVNVLELNITLDQLR